MAISNHFGLRLKKAVQPRIIYPRPVARFANGPTLHQHRSISARGTSTQLSGQKRTIALTSSSTSPTVTTFLPQTTVTSLVSHFSISAKRPLIQDSTSEDQAKDGVRRFREFELTNRVYIVTGAAGGLGMPLAEALVEAGGHVYCLDRASTPPPEFESALAKLALYPATHSSGSLSYRRVDVTDAEGLDSVIAQIAAEHGRLDGLVAAAGVQYICKALDYPVEKIAEMMSINYTGVYLSAVSCARQIIKYRTQGASIVLVGSMSGLIANKQLFCSVYNSSKGAVIQLGRSLAMEWRDVVPGNEDTPEGHQGERKGHPIRVNVLCPGNTMTPMVRKNIVDEPHLLPLWQNENMLGRLADPREYRGAVLFLLSDASSFMTGSHLVIDGGYTAW